MDDNPSAKGGRARSAQLPPERRQEIARAGGKARWADLPRATHEGDLRLGEAVISSAVLDDKRRVLTQSAVMKALGRARQAKGRTYYDGDVNLPAFITAKNLKPFVPAELYVTSSQVEFRRKGGGKAFGYPAELLPKICGVFIDADEANKLAPNQKHIAVKARILLRGLAETGIIALVDEATGYQNDRPKDELQKILSAYISPTLLPWTERFPIDFFKEMFRVYGWAWPFEGDEYKGPLGPRYAGKLIKQIIFENLPPGVLDELERLNPPDNKWQRKSRMSQLLTSEIGHPHIEKLVAVTTALFRVSDNRDQFWRVYHRAFPKVGDQLELLEAD
ncbi:MAG: P63C domain-containing protein [Alphaproteobacteria bacterium]